MKLIEILESRTQVNEDPMGYLNQKLTGLGAKYLPGTMGVRMQGKLTAGEEANTLFKAFYHFLGRTNLPPNGDAIQKFLTANGVDPAYADRFITNPRKRFNKSGLEKIFLKIVYDKASGPAPTPPTVTPTGTPTSTPTGAPSPATPTGPMDNRKFLVSLQRLQGADLDAVRQMLQRRMAMTESAELDEIDFQRLKKRSAKAAKAAGKTISNFGKGVSLGYRDPNRASNLSRNPNTGTSTKVGRLVGRAGNATAGAARTAARAGADTAGNLASAGWDKLKAAPGAIANAAKAAPSAIGSAAGALSAVPGEIGQAYQAARGAPMSMQQIAQTIGTMSPSDAKTVLDFLNTVHP